MRRGRASLKLQPYLLPLTRLAMGSAFLRKHLSAGVRQRGDRMPAGDARDFLDRLDRLTIAEEHLQPMRPADR
jgi:hypothetical protein